jgi:para-nitrobenzyl esterase
MKQHAAASAGARTIYAICTGTAMMAMAGLLVAAGAAAAAKTPIPTGTTLTLADGVIEGSVSGGSRVFLGIPYAAPPTGSLRWRPPAAPTPWVDPLDATTFRGNCPQTAGIVGSPSTDEDCLDLNVWSPNPAPTKPRPVMVWFHGGSNLTGSAADESPFPGTEGLLYDGEKLANTNDVVVVTANYRLGVFGFFGHPDLAAEDPSYPYTGNQGLLDQNAVLRWVRDNIATFGGDPEKVTIFGESAGSFDVCAHYFSPLSAGLFHRAIGQSGSCAVGTGTTAAAAANAANVSAAVGCDMAPDELDCLRSASVADLLAAPNGGSELGNLGIIVDGGFLPEHPRDAIANGNFDRKVPYILGANSDEGTLFFIGSTPVADEAEYLAELDARYGEYADEIAAVYPASAFDTPQDALIRVTGDSTLVCATYELARLLSAAKTKTYVYNFNRTVPLGFVNLLQLGAFHGVEIAFVFGGIEPPSPFDDQLGRQMRDYWASFATKGKPLAKLTGAPKWKKYNGKKDNILRLDAPIVEEIRGFRRTECDLWESLYPFIQ